MDITCQCEPDPISACAVFRAPLARFRRTNRHNPPAIQFRDLRARQASISLRRRLRQLELAAIGIE